LNFDFKFLPVAVVDVVVDGVFCKIKPIEPMTKQLLLEI
jgi:hypothetical protein